jgi:hypothetical protein
LQNLNERLQAEIDDDQFVNVEANKLQHACTTFETCHKTLITLEVRVILLELMQRMRLIAAYQRGKPQEAATTAGHIVF